MPILGDTRYGGLAAARLHLHAWRLGFVHPVTRSALELEAFPQSGSVVEEFDEPRLRERIVDHYRILYSFDGDECRIVRVIRADRDLHRVLSPEDWL